jgi:pSer/pThr/pTyr-binding forkhead associated (FHA) protein
MDEMPPTGAACGPPEPGRRPYHGAAPPPDFVPLRLVLEASGAMVELHRVDNLIGRHSEADVRLPLPDVSRRHCRFLWLDGVWQVVDLHSLNGIYLNDQPVQQATLQQGDRIRIGGFTFVVDLRSAANLSPQDWLGDTFQTYPPHQRRAS